MKTENLKKFQDNMLERNMLNDLKNLPYEELVKTVKELKLSKKQLIELVNQAGGYVTSRDTIDVLKNRLIIAINVERTHKQILGNAKP